MIGNEMVAFQATDDAGDAGESEQVGDQPGGEMPSVNGDGLGLDARFLGAGNGLKVNIRSNPMGSPNIYLGDDGGQGFILFGLLLELLDGVDVIAGVKEENEEDIGSGEAVMFVHLEIAPEGNEFQARDQQFEGQSGGGGGRLDGPGGGVELDAGLGGEGSGHGRSGSVGGGCGRRRHFCVEGLLPGRM